MELALFEVKEKKIGDNTFYVRPFPVLQALELLGDLQAVFTTGLEKFDVKDDGRKDGAPKSFLEKNATIGAAIAGIGENLKGPALVGFAKRLLDSNYVSVKRAGEAEPVRLTADVYNNIFSGNLKQLIELLYFIVVDVNFADFFELVPSHIGTLLSNAKEQLQQEN